MSAKVQVTYRSVNAAVPQRGRDELAPPRWALDLAEESGDDFLLVTARVADAVALMPPVLMARVREAYDSIAARIHGAAARHPVRLWNHIPSIHAPMDEGRDRYMVFNAGRYEAFSNWYGGPATFGRDVATASGVGHDGRDLVIHCLSAREPGVAVANPRQIAPHHYSTKYGPLPPCFARATVLTAARRVLVGGTASIRGEDTLHLTSLPLQISETLENLASVVESAYAGRATARSREQWLRLYRDVRVYYPQAADRETLESAAREAFGPACRVEMRRADLCRAELLVEIEGVAEYAA